MLSVSFFFRLEAYFIFCIIYTRTHLCKHCFYLNCYISFRNEYSEALTVCLFLKFQNKRSNQHIIAFKYNFGIFFFWLMVDGSTTKSTINVVRNKNTEFFILNVSVKKPNWKRMNIYSPSTIIGMTFQVHHNGEWSQIFRASAH